MRSVNEVGGLRLGLTAANRERRLASRLAEAGRDEGDERLRAVVEDAQLLGSLELAGLRPGWDEVRASRQHGQDGPVRAWRRARAAVEPAAPLTLDALRAWHRALLGPTGFRTTERAREGGPPPPPPPLIESRLALLEQWLGSRSAEDLQPEQAAALALARIVEVLPFEDGNGRVARLAASHVMVRGGRRPPILVAADAPRLVAAFQAAFALHTEPLGTLLEEASARALEVMIQALEKNEI